jgi:hypothetical protein
MTVSFRKKDERNTYPNDLGDFLVQQSSVLPETYVGEIPMLATAPSHRGSSHMLV